MERALTYATLALVVLMMMLGAIVHGTGSSLACPDWPLCYGSAMPKMEGGVLFEHSHRLLGTLIGMFTLGITFITLKRHAGGAPKQLVGGALGLIIAHAALAGFGVSKTIWPVAIIGFALDLPLIFVLLKLGRTNATVAYALTLLQLVITQGILGGMTVVLQLPYVVSAGHLEMSMIVLTLLAVLAVRFAPTSGPAIDFPRRRLGFLIGALLLQIFLGALIKHTGASLACGIDIVLCNGGAPHGGPAHLQYTHRIFAMILLAGVVFETLPILKAAKRAGNKQGRILAIAAHALVTFQIILGIGTVQTYIAIPLATLHLGVGALLLGSLVTLFTVMGRAGGVATAPATSPQREPAHAT